MLSRRLAQALLLLVGALVLHPLMAVGGVLIFALWWSATRLPRRWCLVGLLMGVGLAGAIVMYQPLGSRFFGPMDDEWKTILLNVCFSIDPSRWQGSDWVRIAWAFAVVSVAAITFARSSSIFLGAVLAAALIGLAGTVIAVQSHYLLLLQTSPYRAMWLLEFLAAPLAVQGAFVLLGQGGYRRTLGVGLLLLASCDWNNDPFPVLGVFLLPLLICAVGFRGLSASPRRPDWLKASAAPGLVLTSLVLGAYNLGVFARLLSTPPTSDLDIHPVLFLQTLAIFCYKLPLLLAVLGVTAALWVWLGPRRLFPTACVVLWLGFQALSPRPVSRTGTRPTSPLLTFRCSPWPRRCGSSPLPPGGHSRFTGPGLIFPGSGSRPAARATSSCRS